MKRVAIVNGVARQLKYNQYLTKKYEEIGYVAKEYKFNPAILFCCHLHKSLDVVVKEIVEDHDVIHCQSGGYFPVIHYYAEKNHRKPFIFETPVLRSATGTLLAGLSVAKSYETVPDVKIVQKMLDTFCFTPQWTAKTMSHLSDLKERNLSLVLASKSDTVSDNRGKHDMLHHHFDKGKHARLFYDNDFKVIIDFLSSHPHHKHHDPFHHEGDRHDQISHKPHHHQK